MLAIKSTGESDRTYDSYFPSSLVLAVRTEKFMKVFDMNGAVLLSICVLFFVGSLLGNVYHLEI